MTFRCERVQCLPHELSIANSLPLKPIFEKQGTSDGKYIPGSSCTMGINVFLKEPEHLKWQLHRKTDCPRLTLVSCCIGHADQFRLESGFYIFQFDQIWSSAVWAEKNI